MSHLVTIQTEVRDPLAIARACERLTLPPPVYGSARLFASEATGWQVQLPQWRYPLVCATQTGQLHFDTFEGRWGSPRELSQFLQRYAVEKTLLTARQQGYAAYERPLADGSIQVTLQTGAAE